MEKPISKLLGKLKLTDSGSVKFSGLKKKHDTAANNSNNSNANTASSSGGGGGGGGVVPPAAVPSVVVSPSRLGQGQAAPGGGGGGGGAGGGCGLGLAPSQLLAPTAPSPAGGGDGEQQPPLHPSSSLAPLRRRSPQQRASCYLGEGVDSHLRRESGLGPEMDPLGSRGSLNQRRYSLEMQQLVRRQQLLSQTPPPLSVPPPYPAAGYGSAPRGGGGGGGVLMEPGYLSEPERHKRLSLQESLFYKRLSTGGEIGRAHV